MKVFFSILGFVFLALFVLGFFIKISDALKFSLNIDKWSDLFRKA